jgi:predicted RNA binding protein YcfA (HicA-like mRNA interferase family)
MPPIPVLRPAEVVRAFEAAGWRVVRQLGGHIILTRIGPVATLSVPDRTEVGRGTLRALIARAGLTVDEFLDHLDRA